MDIYIITGHLGSGKTEVAVNFALHTTEQLQQSDDSSAVAVVDIDVINPYFAAREVRDLLESRGIKVAAPSIKTTTADLPVLSGEVYRMLHSEEHVVIIDVGGDSAGAKILGSLYDHLHGKTLHVYCVVNTKRPSTSIHQGILAYIRRISHVSRLPMTGLIHNTHLLDETSVDDICQGQKLVEEVAQETGLPIVFTAVMKELGADIDGCLGNELLLMDRYIKPPYV